jgi:hypothetical protein
MNKLGFLLFFVAATVFVIAAEPVQYRANQRVRVLQKQQEKPEENPDSENVEVTITKSGGGGKSRNHSDKQVEQQEEVEEPRESPDAQPELEDKSNETPYVPSGSKPGGNLLVLPVGGWFYVSPQVPVATMTEAQTFTTEEASKAPTTEVTTTTD